MPAVTLVTFSFNLFNHHPLVLIGNLAPCSPPVIGCRLLAVSLVSLFAPL